MTLKARTGRGLVKVDGLPRLVRVAPAASPIDVPARATVLPFAAT